MGEPTTFTEKVVAGAILLASKLTETYKFEWLVERHLEGFDGDDMMLKLFCGGDEHIFVHADAFLQWAFNHALVICRIERVAAVLSKDKVIYGSGIDRILLETYDNDLAGLDFTPMAALRFQEFIPAPDLFQRREKKQPIELKIDRARVTKGPIETIIGFQVTPKSKIPLRIVSFEAKDEKTGEIHKLVSRPELALHKFEEFGVRTVENSP